MSTIEIEPFYDPATSTLSYLVYDRGSRDAVVIDPVLDYDAASGKLAVDSALNIARRIRELGLVLHYVLETHAHADHLSASQYFKGALGAKVAIGERIREVQATFKPVFGLPASFPADGSQFDRLLRDGEIVHAGELAFEVIATPGHTPACVSYRIEDAVFTGDALFVEDSGTGRCDFPRGDAEALYRSVHDRLYALPGPTRVFVGHDYQPGGRELRWMTTIDAERERNIQLTITTTRDEYVAFRRARDRTLAAPRLRVGCVDVAVSPYLVAHATRIRFDFENRCDIQATVDLRSVRVVARDMAGEDHILEPFDPRGEIRALPIDALTYGDELIEYSAAVEGIDTICVDVAAIDGRRPVLHEWLCAAPRTVVAR